ncbi:hypothetical protein D9758_004463 [Tetrapyrgos nigripes]|uniref:Carrier domain-containing protein n=1 Tax=Tetrapyrgos nigripes TaxID=182062 RepID=A0A8H5GN25_9AGAR|nr:hypothetical protein D9758_004463 [Tetrapyrgos nigripes]
MDSVAKELAGYSFQALPDLGTCLRHPPNGTHHVHKQLPDVSSENYALDALLRAAFFKVVLLYLDTRDFLFYDATSSHRTSVRAQLVDGQTFRDLVTTLQEKSRSDDAAELGLIRQILGLKDSENPLPVCSMALVGRDSKVELYVDSTIMSLHAAEVFLGQVLATLSFITSHLDEPSTSPLELPQPLMSAYENEYNRELAELTLLWLRRNASSRPDAVAHEVYKAVAEPPEVLTYGHLNLRSNRVARWLVGRGLQKEDKVAVCRMRDAHFYVAHAAVFKSGGCYVSVDPELPEERKRFIAEDSEARFVLTTAEHADLFGERAVVLDDPSVQNEIGKEDGSDICLAELDSLAYLLYTSGTTGTPKGCLLNHRGLYWAIEAMCVFPHEVTNPDTDKRLALASIAFDVHISEICQSWRLGTRLVSGPRYELLANLQENIISMGITHLGMVPSMIEATLSSPDDLPLKYLVSGGEKISDSLLKKWANHDKLILANFYGPTEATVGCTSRQVKLGDRKENIGKPFTSCQVYVVDSRMNVVPRGTPGELVVEGPLVGRGYNKLPEVTEKVFLEWPRPGCWCYRTGDLVRLMPDNTLEIMGRIDTQIKLRGVRIESEGVSNVLRNACSETVDVSTLISNHPDFGGTEVLVSFVAIADPKITFLQRRSERPVIIDKMDLMVKSMKDAAVRELAVYMRPSYIVPMNFLPLSINGKTDNKILAQIFKDTPIRDLLRQGDADTTSTSTQPARSPSTIESRVIDVVAELAGLSAYSLSPVSNLYECGLDSLKFSTLASTLRKEFSTTVSAAQLMGKPVIEDIALMVDTPPVPQARNDQALINFAEQWSGLAEGIFEPHQIQSILPPFPVQEGVLFRSMQSPQLYVQHFMYRCDPSIDLERMKESWQKVVSRQQILRTVFVIDDTLVQVVIKDSVNDLPWRVVPCQLSSQESFEEWFLREESSSVAIRVTEDLTTPLFFINVYDASEKGTFMVFSINHALYDGNSMSLIIREFRRCYEELPLLHAVPLIPVLEALSAIDQQKCEEFWRSQFAEVDLEGIVVRHPSDGKGTFISRSLNTSLGDIQACCNAAHVTLQAFFSTAFSLAGRHVFNWRENAVFGVVRAGRSLPVNDIEEAICPLVSVVPTVLPLDARASSSKLLDTAQQYINATLPYEHTPLGCIHRWLGVQDLVEVLLSCRFDSESQPTNVIEHIASSRSQSEFIFALELVMHATADYVEARLLFVEADLPSEHIDGEVIYRSQKDANDTQPDAHDMVDKRLESALLKSIADFLHVETSMLHPMTSLASLGLSSIKAVALARLLSQQGIKVTPVDIVQADHVRGISRRIITSSGEAAHQSVNDSIVWLGELKKRLWEELDVEHLKLSAVDKLELTGCTALQTGMLAQTINSGGRLYVHAFTFQLLPQSDISRLKSAWYQAVHCLSILRTSFHFAPNVGQWAQIVHSDVDFKWSEIQESQLSPSAATDFISSLHFERDESLARPPIYFQHRSAQNDYLIVVLHHALYDGIAIPKLLRVVKKLYHGDHVPPPVPFQQVADAVLAQEKEGARYWARKLDGVTPWHFPRSGDPSVSLDKAWRASIALQISVTEIRRFCRRYHVHPQCLGQVAWAKILCRRSHLPEVVFGQVVSGRTLSDADDVIGPVFNTIPCKVVITRGETNKQLMRSMHEWNNDGLTWQHASLRAIQRQLGIPNLLDTLFLFQPDGGASPEEDQLWKIVGRGDIQESKTQHAFNLELHETEKVYSVYASCAANVMKHSELVLLLSEFNETFAELVRRPTAQAFLNYDDMFMQTLAATPESQTTNLEHDDPVPKALTPRQTRMHEILVEFTGLPSESVTLSTPLTAIGIDSICAIQVAAMARRADISLVASDVARSTTVMDLLSLLENSVQLHKSPSFTSAELPSHVIDGAYRFLPPGFKEHLTSVLPLSAGMEADISFWKTKGVVFPYQLDREESTGELSSRLRAAWSQLVLKHEILRSFWLPTGEQDYRLVLATLKTFHYSWIEEVLDAGLDSSDETELASVKRLARDLVSTPVPTNQPPVRLALLHGKKSSYFLLSLHHVQYDGWSLPLLIKDLEQLYVGKSATSGSDMAGFLRLFVRTSEVQDEQAAYWKRVFPSKLRLRLLPYHNLPKEAEDQALSSVILSQITRLFPTSLSSRSSVRLPTFVKLAGVVSSMEVLERRAQSLQLSSQAILLACWSVIQAKWSSTSSATFLLSHAGRSGILPDLDTLAVPCCNYLPTHVVMDFDPMELVERSIMSTRILSLASHIQKDIASRSPVVEQSHVRDISEWVGAGGTPLSNVSVNVLKLPGGSHSTANPTARVLQPLKIPYDVHETHLLPDDNLFPEIRRDCQVEIFYRGNDCGISIECDAALLSANQAHRMGMDWASMVKNVEV